jgi:polysaccharide export outer membrane protein
MTSLAQSSSSFRRDAVSRHGSAIQRWLPLIAAGLLVLFSLAGCSDGPRENLPGPQAAPVAAGEVPLPEDANVDYTLGSGDKLRVIVYGEKDLSGEFDISGAGNVALPLVGQVRAQGLTVGQFETAVENALKQGYLNEPRVSVEVLNYRPFYIYGEVGEAGQYPYSSGMTVLNAIAVAGGYTYRAGNEVEYPASQAVKILPGDVIRVPERFF